jgi:hypothetical protein
LEPANPIKLILTSLHQSKKRRNGKKAPLALEKEAPTNREKEPVVVVKTYLVKTGEDWRDAVVVVWTLVLTVAAEMDDVGRRLWKNKKDQGRLARAVVEVDGGWLLAERKRLRDRKSETPSH